MSADQYPRWVYLDNDLSKGIVVADEAAHEQAKADGYADFVFEDDVPDAPKAAATAPAAKKTRRAVQ